jgi:cyclopropane-fatty-acyl-phospholipid synthase
VPLFALFMANATAMDDLGRANGPWRWAMRAFHWLHRNTRAGSRRNIQAHYDLGNDFYEAWLDPTMCYSSARFEPGDTLEEAQRRKLDSIASRLQGARDVLEVGCGWGALARHLGDGGAQVTAISLSDEQLAFARQRHAGAAIEFCKQDYRDVQGQFDGIVSVEMVEAVGREYWPDFFDCIARNLKPGGRAVIQYIAMRDDLFEAYARSADFIQAYIFPGGLLVKESEFARLAAERGLEWQNREGFALDYAETLRQWRVRFDKAFADGRLPRGFDQNFVDLWRYYLVYCEGGFRGLGIDVAQVTLFKRG